MSEEVQAPSRKRLIVFGVLAVLFALAAVGPRPFMFPWIATLWAGEAGDMRSHELHGIVNSFILYATLVAVGLHVTRKHRETVGAVWALMIVGILPIVMMIALGGIPEEAPMGAIVAILALGVAVFLAHPAPMAEKFRSHGVSPVLLGLAVVVAVPLVVFAAGQYSMHLRHITGDEHREFGHWLVMGTTSFGVTALAFLAAVRVSGHRTAGWFAVAALALIAVGSLVLPATQGAATASTWATPWALGALVWAGAFAVAMHRDPVPVEEPVPSPAAAAG